MTPYECDPVTGFCGGGFGVGGDPAIGGGQTYAWGVTGIPYFGGSNAGGDDPGGGNIFGGLIQQGVGFGLNYLGQQRQQSQQSNQRDAQLEQQWDQLVAQVLALYQALSAKARISPDELQQAEAAYAALEQTSKSSTRIAQQWNDPGYGPAFRHDLELYRSRLDPSAASAADGSGGTLLGIPTDTLLIVALAIAAVFAMKN